MDNEKLFELMEKMYVEMQKGFKDVNGRIDGLEKEVKKVNFTIENDIQPKISVLFEGYSSNKEETERKLEEVIKEQRETKEILTLSVKSLSEDIKNLNEKMDKVEKVTMKNTYDVEYLKLAK